MVNEMRVFMKAEKSRGQSSVRMIMASCAPAPKSSPDKPRQRLWGVLKRKARWGLSWQGWLILFATLVVAAGFLLLTIHPFLAVTHRVNANILVVEGWIHEYAIRAGAQEFMAGSYPRVFTTGGPVTGSGGYTWDADTSASVGASQLRKCGVRPESVQMVPSHVIGRDRTYYSAVALRDWFRERKMNVGSINVVTESTHARRTWLLFREAFGNRVSVGIIAVHNPDYDAKHWWRSSDGFREVVSEAMAYIYARFLFRPPEQLDPS
jgi:uncharacterized SAM-binding protein YcdF (DUF218 family)